MSPKNGFESFIHDHSSGFSALAQRPGRGNLYGRLCHGSSCFRSRRRRVQTSPTEGRMPSRKDLERSTSSARLFFTFRFPVFFHLAGLSKPRCKKSQICRQNHRSASRWQAPVPCFIPSPSNRTFSGAINASCPASWIFYTQPATRRPSSPFGTVLDVQFKS